MNLQPLRREFAEVGLKQRAAHVGGHLGKLFLQTVHLLAFRRRDRGDMVNPHDVARAAVFPEAVDVDLRDFVVDVHGVRDDRFALAMGASDSHDSLLFLEIYNILKKIQYIKQYVEAKIMNIEKKIPHEVVEMVVDGDSPIRAWRKYLHMTQAEAAEKMQISQSAFAQMEKVRKSQKTTLRNVAKAFGLAFEQLDLL